MTENRDKGASKERIKTETTRLSGYTEFITQQQTDYEYDDCYSASRDYVKNK